MMEQRLEQLEIQLAWQADLLASLNQTVAALNREVGEQARRITLLQEELRQQRLSANPAANAQEKPPHY